ncbi:hypothetical protein EUGRSUZ_J02793 [Eucalyptus grandis]|uniref:Uncharacterized protein n=2 Tax=Eucalyptus grandis TaxID=71139 RepID=A0ACC3JB75_EUCGR|nr:hypothetical protein EUGRSUZ_J02793 [Eucalyptus grandis]
MGDQIFSLDKNELSTRVYAGVLLKDDREQGEAKNGEDREPPYTRKYWVDKKLNKNCWKILAKDLSIASDDKYWQWTEEEEPCYSGNKKVHVAELKRICWLEINGKCNTIMLSPRTKYEVEILVKIREGGRGWDAPVNLSLALPDGNKQERMERLEGLEKEKWHRISIGQFETTPKTHRNGIVPNMYPLTNNHSSAVGNIFGSTYAEFFRFAHQGNQFFFFFNQLTPFRQN